MSSLPPLALAVIGVMLLLVVVSVLSESGALGYGSTQVTLGDAASLALTLGAAMVAGGAAWIRRDLAGWGLIALALLAWSAGDIYYWIGVDAIEGPYPSIADALYLAFYGLAVAGLLNLVARVRGRSLSIPSLLTPLLGLATLWSWLVFDPVLGSLGGTTAARMTTIAYPCLDLLLICVALVALAAHGWRTGTTLLLLIAGVAIVGVADAVFAARVADGALPEQELIDSLWPLGAVLIAAAAWFAREQDGEEEGRSGIMDLALSLPAVGVATLVLVVDHFERLHDMTVALAGLTLVAAASRLVILYREAEQARSERGRIEMLHAASAEAAQEAIVTVDERGIVVDWNPAAERIFGYGKDAAMGRTVPELIVPAGIRDGWNDAFNRFVAGQAQHFAGRRIEMTGLRSDGVELPIELTVARVSDDPPLFTSFIADITERKHREAERDLLAEMVRSAEDAMYSTDRDMVVIAWNPAAERIFGYSAEEIVGTNLERLVPADRRDELMRLSEELESGETISVETKRVRGDGDLIDVALRVYPVRDEIGRITSYSSLARDITDRRKREREQRLHREREAWRSHIEDALDGDGFEFHRQPVLDLKSGSVAHHELLLRMRLEGEVVSPGRFLPYAESSSPLIRRIDRWAIRHGIALAAERPVAINLSAKSLSDAGIAKAVQSALDESGAEPRNVTFEITETAAAEQLEDAHALVAALRSLGCGVALDDFGTGYGSFTYLLRMPVTSLKIDMEFIRALSDDPADQRVVGSILAVAKNFGLTTVAEGVEEESTLRLLSEMGVDEIQGYLVGRPQPEWATEADMAPILASAGAA